MKTSMRFLFLTVAAAIAACSVQTQIAAPQSDVMLRVRERSYTALPAADKLATTSFGNYEFRAERPGADPLYGVLPLKFNGGYLALDILFFAPAMFFNLRGPFAQYEVDMQQRVIRFRNGDSQGWMEYTPTLAEAEQARRYFSDSK